MRKFIRKPLYTEQLKQWIIEAIDAEGFSVDLNHIDVSDIEDFEGLFQHSRFNGDISKWNVSKVTNMKNMFYGSGFNGDISQWNTSNVINMQSMFAGSEFNGDISNWNTSKVTHMSSMFNFSEFNGDISRWNVSQVTDMTAMFQHSSFNGNISKWDVSNVTSMNFMFKQSTFTGDLSQWKYHPECMAWDAISCYHPSVLGMLAIYADDFKLPPEHVMASRYTEVANIAKGLGMPDMQAALYIYRELYGGPSAKLSIGLPADSTWMNEVLHD